MSQRPNYSCKSVWHPVGLSTGVLSCSDCPVGCELVFLVWWSDAAEGSGDTPLCVGCSADGFCFDFNGHFCQTEKGSCCSPSPQFISSSVWFNFIYFYPLNPNIKCQKTLLLYILLPLFFFLKEVVYMYICYQLFVYDFKVNKNYDLFLIKVVRVDCLMLLWMSGCFLALIKSDHVRFAQSRITAS